MHVRIYRRQFLKYTFLETLPIFFNHDGDAIHAKDLGSNLREGVKKCPSK